MDFMAKPEPDRLLAEARKSLANPMDFETFLARLAPKDRVNAQRRVEVLEAEPDPSRVQLWKRLTCALMTLASHSAKLVGRQMIQFYVADGKYRMQVFALEDLQDGQFTLYCPNVLKEAIDAGLIRPAEGQPNLYVPKSGGLLFIETIDGQSPNSAPHFKDMVGWNRKAIRIVLPPSASPAQVEATVLLCAIAAGHFRKPTVAGDT
jgi:hypothetical protein